jgi:hypothetical protein
VSTPARSRSRLLGAAVALLTAVSLTACVQVPRKGSVVEAQPRGQDDTIQVPYNNPPPPQPRATRKQIVLGFLEAMTATPIRTAPAKEFLTTQEQTRWQPQQVLAYAGHGRPRGHRDVVLRLRHVDRIGAGGQWRGAVPDRAARITFPMVQEDGEWRIASAPNALILQRGFYEQHFTRDEASLYFVDPTGRILVPEPVHVPQGSQLASSLVRALLQPSRASLTGVERSFIPPGLSAGIAVPVDRGVAQVGLTGTDPGPLSTETTHLMLAQLAWTLRQDTSIDAFTLTVAGRTITDETGNSRFSVHDKAFDDVDPAVATASGQTYALRHGLLVSGPVNHLTKVEGPFGETSHTLRHFAVNLDSTRVAGVQVGALLVGPVLGRREPREVLTGTGLLTPAWDFADRLWEVQNDPVTGARVLYVAHGRQHPVRVRGITGEEVRRFLVSRDGSRLVAVLRGPAADRLVASRLRYDGDGRAVGATRAQPIRWLSPGATRIRDIGWTSPTTIAVLDQLSSSQAEVRILDVDGSTRADQASPTVIHGRVLGLATSPNQTPYAVQRSALYDFSQVDEARSVSTEGLRYVTYAG